MNTTQLRRFFELDLKRSIWFWVTGTMQTALVSLAVLTVADRWDRERLGGNALLLMGVAVTISLWFACLGEFRRIRKLPIEWDKLEPGGASHRLLESWVRMLYIGAGMSALITGIVMSALSS